VRGHDHYRPTVPVQADRTFHGTVKCRRGRSRYTRIVFGKYPLAEVGALLAEPSRVAMLTVLLDGLRHSAGELAIAAGLSPQAASAHLGKLTDGGFLQVSRVGRRRLFALARPEVGQALESLGAIARTGAGTAAASKADKPLRFARTCYDHLAGQVAVGMAHALVAEGVLRPHGTEYQVLSTGTRWLDEMDIDLSSLRQGRRKLARQCLDWTERESHLGGALGAAVLARCLAAGWVTRIPGTRAVHVTDRGSRMLGKVMGLDVSSCRSTALGVPA
jgi:DNA-binding transcriptional ArsR family regulator